MPWSERIDYALILAYFIAPAWAANMAAPLVVYWQGWNAPVSRRLFGDHKTVMGIVFALCAALLATALQALIGLPVALVDYHHWALLGVGFGAGAMGGDLLKSFCKRRAGIRAGAPWVPFDQIDFVIGALALVAPFSRVTIHDALIIVIMTFAGDLAVNRLAFAAGIKSTPW